MAKKKQVEEKEVYIESEPMYQPITETIETNYMPYVVSVMVSRAIPEIDGFKPSHRKLLYTMYKMGLMTGHRTKSANIVGETMKLNPHGDASIYETMVRLTRGNESLLHPFVDSKGSFGKQYSRDMAFAASRYTEAKLDPFCAEIFSGIDKNAVEMMDNYDSTMKEPRLLPTTFPNVLVSPNLGIAVGLASSICSFNLVEICDATIAILKSSRVDTDRLMEIVKAPDFSGGGYVVYEPDQIRKIYETGKGSLKLRAKYKYDAKANCIEILEIPYSTSIEAILKEISDMFKAGKLKEVTDFRDEIDLSGFKLTIDLKKGTDPEALMQKLFKFTPLEDSFACNFNVLIDSVPRQMGIKEILVEWIRFRIGCLTREFTYELTKKNDKLHLLLGLSKILLDIDKAIKIVKETEKDEMVVPNLMTGFGIDKEQAEYIADIKLRHLNREYIMNRLEDIEKLKGEIAELKALLEDEIKMKSYIIKQLNEIKKKYGKPRKTEIIQSTDIAKFTKEDLIEDFACSLFLTKEGYLKKITQQSLRGNSEQKFKEGDSLLDECEARNKDDLIFFTNKAQIYFAKVSDFELSKASELGEYVPKVLKFDDDEKPIFMKLNPEYKEDQNIIFFFENGKAVRVPMSEYATQGARKKLKKAYSDASPIVKIIYETSDDYILILNSDSKAILIRPSLIPIKTTRSSIGTTIFAMNLKKKQVITEVLEDYSERFPDAYSRYRKIKIPAVGVLLSEKDITTKQIKIEPKKGRK
ncbi:MAG: topoisomerase IV [Ruminococcaceae bacterium]|nr:topoisomerase IV [Oscillospiraceae bacterium]